MDDADLVAAVTEDLAAYLECGRPVSDDPREAAYQQALGVVCSLREALGRDPLGLVALAWRREDECGGAMLQVGRLRAALRRVAEDAEAGRATLPAGTQATVQDALQ